MISRKTIAVIAVILIAGGVGYHVLFADDGNPSEDGSAERALDRTYNVVKGDFNITVLADGALDAIKRHDLRCEIRRGERILTKLVEDKSHVKKDEVVFEFSNEKLQQELEQKQSEMDDVVKELEVAKEDMKMNSATNLSSIKVAADNLRVKNESLEKYLDLEYSKQRKELQKAISDAGEKLISAKEKLSEARDALSNNQSTEESAISSLEDKIEQAEAEVDAAKTAIATASHNFRVFRQYDHPQKLRSLEEGVEQAELNLKKVLINAKGSVIQSERRIENHKRRIQWFEDEIKRIQEDLDNMVVKAPVDGIISFGNPNLRHWQEPKEYKIGTNLGYREIVATIPDLSKFLVNVDIAEEFRSRIKLGLQAKLSSSVVPDLKMEGELFDIAPMAQQTINWDKGSPKIYPCKISTDSSDPRMMPGMTVKAEIVVETVKDAIYVPVEAVYNREGQAYARLKTLTGDTEIKVETGRSSVHYVEILSGIKDGDEVMLFRRAGAKK